MGARSADIPFLRVPVGHDAHRWSTFPGERRLVVATRTLTSTIRVLETLPSVLRADPRVTVVFAHDPTSAFGDGSLDLLYDSGCRVMPWDQLAHIDPDLILSASENIEVPEGDCPVLVLPHGIGFQKYVPDSRAPRSRLSGVAPDALLEAGRAWTAVSHPEQERQLLAAHPKSAGRTLLIGDPCLDELLVSADRRDGYRRALGVADGQRLVLVSSTWGPTSLIGRDPGLPARLLAGLPWDEYRVALVLHPNVWAAHGAWYLRALQAEALDAGLLLIPPVHDWRPALVAADAVIGDHGSVTLYGAALGKPLALAAYGTDAVPGTAGADLAGLAPRYDPEASPLPQIEAVVRDHADEPERYAPVAARAFDTPGTALARLRTALYDLLRLEPPAAAAPPAPLALTAPGNSAAAVASWVVGSHMEVDAGGRVTVRVSRVPAAVADVRGEEDADVPGDEDVDVRGEEEGDFSSRLGARYSRLGARYSRLGARYSRLRARYSHLCVRPDEERDRRLTESASVLVASAPAPTPVAALRWVRDALADRPGSLLAATALSSGECLVALRDGRTVLAPAAPGAMDPGLVAAVVYTLLRAGRPPTGGPVTLRVGDTRNDIELLRPSAPLHTPP
ncbi:hypothetical protein [Streptomyces anatolicus]|uniref:hypothetical protein n=1 Tax=Streptomyces anatolicus TaxID=2675858 RepID=UPI001CA5EBAA|nr:hypothetical protein [Streptomyces anatolicus]